MYLIIQPHSYLPSLGVFSISALPLSAGHTTVKPTHRHHHPTDEDGHGWLAAVSMVAYGLG